MSKPRVFISSTFYEFKHIRSSLETFIDTLGYDAILSEKGSIAYNPDIPLDESCYREASLCDIFVLIIGNSYGSAKSSGEKPDRKDSYTRYESITQMEYEAASQKDIPVYILIEKSVYAEFNTFQRNRDNANINYAHVDSVNIFYFIEKIIAQPRNNPIFSFERHQDIQIWLREQWAGLFKDFLSRRSESRQISSIAKQVQVLAEINITLKRYLETVVSKVSEEDAAKIIKEEDKRLLEARTIIAFTSKAIVKLLTSAGLSVEDAIGLFRSPTINDFNRNLETKLPRFSNSGFKDSILSEQGLEGINSVRAILGLEPYKLSKR